MGQTDPGQQGRWRWNGREWVDSTRPPGPPWRLIGGAVAGLLVLAALAYVALGRLTEPPAPTSGGLAATTPTPSPRPTASASAEATPPPAPPVATGSVKAVTVAANGPCAAGGSCALEVTVEFPLTTADTEVAWSVAATDVCSGGTTALGTQHVTAQTGWNHVIGDTTVTLPAARGPLRLVATTSSPGTASSPPLQVGSGAC